MVFAFSLSVVAYMGVEKLSFDQSGVVFRLYFECFPGEVRRGDHVLDVEMGTQQQSTE